MTDLIPLSKLPQMQKTTLSTNISSKTGSTGREMLLPEVEKTSRANDNEADGSDNMDWFPTNFGGAKSTSMLLLSKRGRRASVSIPTRSSSSGSLTSGGRSTTWTGSQEMFDDVTECPKCSDEILTKGMTRHLREACSFRPAVCPNPGCGASMAFRDLMHHRLHTCPFIERRRALAAKAGMQGDTSIGVWHLCPNGCGIKFPEGRGARHAKNDCTHRLVTCRNDGCKERIKLVNLEKHEKVECKVVARRAKLAEKRRKYNEEYVKCSPNYKGGCKQMILRRNLKRHEREECPKRRVECLTIGCNERIRLHKMEMHLKHDCKPILKRNRIANNSKQLYKCKLGCGEMVPLARITDHMKNHCDFRMVPCRIMGCDKQVRYIFREKHEAQCPIFLNRQKLAGKAMDQYGNAECALGCGVVLRKRDQAFHSEHECLKRLVMCRNVGCNKMVPFCSLKEHSRTSCIAARKRKMLQKMKVVRSQTFECPYGCGMMVMKKHAVRHKKKECPLRLIKCPYSGCGASFPAEELEEHKQHDCKSLGIKMARKYRKLVEEKNRSAWASWATSHRKATAVGFSNVVEDVIACPVASTEKSNP